MINASELRLGNYVTHNNPNLSPKYLRVLSVSSHGINHWLEDSIKPRIEFETLEPIPLTSEILEKCGFEKEEGNRQLNGIYYTADNFLMLFVSNDDGKITFGFENDWAENVDVEIKYVHQLQNLYFVLIGEELKIQL